MELFCFIVYWMCFCCCVVVLLIVHITAVVYDIEMIFILRGIGSEMKPCSNFEMLNWMVIYCMERWQPEGNYGKFSFETNNRGQTPILASFREHKTICSYRLTPPFPRLSYCIDIRAKHISIYQMK